MSRSTRFRTLAAPLARTLGSPLLTVDGEQHGVVSGGSDGVDSAVADHLIDPKVPVRDACCCL